MKKTEPKKYDCAKVEKLVQAYLDDHLSDEEILKIEDHLSYCLPCDKKVEFEIKLKELIKHKASEKDYPKNLEEELKKIVENSSST
jgi:anti-sigma factor (TIGR02949 family)